MVPAAGKIEKPKPKTTPENVGPALLKPLSGPEVYARAVGKVVVIQNCAADGSPRAFGSGFILQKPPVIVTNYHVVKAAHHLLLKTNEGKQVRVDRILAFSENKDIAILPFPEAMAQAHGGLKLADSLPRIGDPVHAIGAPQGLEFSFTSGTVNGYRAAKFYGMVVQISAQIDHGSSGGPLLDQWGDVVGVATFGQKKGSKWIDFAVAGTEVASVLKEVNGEARLLRSLSGYLGMTIALPLRLYNADRTISVEIPRDWFSAKTESSLLVASAITRRDPIQARVDIAQHHPNRTLEEQYRRLKQDAKEYRELRVEIHIGEIRKTRVDSGYPAVRSVERTARVTAIYYDVRHGGRGYLIECATAHRGFARWRSVLDRIGRSFRVHSPRHEKEALGRLWSAHAALDVLGVRAGYVALREVADQYGGTLAAERASAMAERLRADPILKKQLPTAEFLPSEKAHQMLKLARNYIRNGLAASAEMVLNEIVERRPNSAEGREAKKLLEKLPK